MSSTKLDSIEHYKEGDIPEEWIPLVSSVLLDDFKGNWELILERSDPCDKIMTSLGISPFKCSLLKHYKTTTSIDIIQDARTSSCFVKLLTYFPLGQSKSGLFPLDGTMTHQKDNDTNVEWDSFSLFSSGRFVQKRTSSKGTIYDTRCIFKHDPENKSSESPIKLFKWTYINPEKKELTAMRWFKKK